MLTAVKDTAFLKHQSIQVRGSLLNINKVLTMGILNITNDSFHSGSRVLSHTDYLAAAKKMVVEGADFLDIGAYSTRPGADDISIEEETDRLCEAISAIHAQHPEILLSADTFRAAVAEKAIEAGADIINDVSGGILDDKMFETVARLRVPYILMHYRGSPKTMNSLAVYDDLLGEIIFELSEKVNRLRLLGVADIIIDPGFGFAKTATQNFELLKRLRELELFGLPILTGLSRKSMVWRTLDCKPEEALNGTTALNMLALENGANILRVHDVKEAKEVIALWEKYNEA